MSREQPISKSVLSRVCAKSTWCRKGWTFHHVVAAAALVALAVLALWDTWSDIYSIAMNDEESSHLFLVPFVAAWLLWIRRERLRNYVPASTWVGPVTVAFGWALNRVGDTYNIQSFWHFGAVLVVVGAFLTVAGGGFLARFLPVFVSLCFLVPVPGRVRQAIAIPLQAASADITQKVLETMGASVERSGNLLSINHRDVMIAEACNGLRMVFALVLVSFVFAYGTPLRNGVRALIVLSSPLTAIVFNVIRLVPTVWMFGSFSPDFANAVHDVSGWLMLPIAFVSLLGVMRLLRWAQIPITPYILAYGS
jgi:exosortase